MASRIVDSLKLSKFLLVQNSIMIIIIIVHCGLCLSEALMKTLKENTNYEPKGLKFLSSAHTQLPEKF